MRGFYPKISGLQRNVAHRVTHWPMSAKGNFSTIAAVFAFLGVALGAFGAHGLKEVLEANGRMDTWETAVFYQLIHAVALFALPAVAQRSRAPGWCFVIGMILFSGSLYALALGLAPAVFGPVTPIGGVFFLVGWGWLVMGTAKKG